MDGKETEMSECIRCKEFNVALERSRKMYDALRKVEQLYYLEGHSDEKRLARINAVVSRILNKMDTQQPPDQP